MSGARRRWLRYLWPAVYSVIGLVLAWLAVACGGWWRVRAGALECGGGRLAALAARLPRRYAFSAITLGHVILGLDGATLDAARRHEQVHVRQYERWGPLFGPAYLASSLLQWLRGRRPYLDNHFERQAYGEAARRGPGPGPD
ncbi:MAG TPA: signal peptide prediction [Ramlibacter sp.]